MLVFTLDDDAEASLRGEFMALGDGAYLRDDEKIDIAASAFVRAVTTHGSKGDLFLQIMDAMASGAQTDPVLFRNLPIDLHLPPTPPQGKRPEGKGLVSEWTMLALGRLMGTHAIGYHNEKDGEIIHQVCPVQGHEAEKSNMGSDDFAFHIEAPHHEFPPDYIMLLCLRGNPQAYTTFIRLDHALAEVSRYHLKMLYERDMPIKLAPSFGAEGNRKVRCLELDLRRMRVLARFDLEEMIPDTREMEHALNEVRIACQKHVQQHSLRPGEAVVLNNRAVLHGRTKFPVVYDGTQRWLQRAYLVRDTTAGKMVDDRWPRVWDGR